MSWLASFWPIFAKSKECIYVQHIRFLDVSVLLSLSKRDRCWSHKFISSSLFLSLSLLSGGEAWWSLDDPQTDPRHQHESAWATGESLHCECLFLLRAVLAGLPDAYGSKEAYILPPLGQVLTFSLCRIIFLNYEGSESCFVSFRLICCVSCTLGKPLSQHMFLELIM